MTAPRKPHPIESLPFVRDRAPNSRTNMRRCFWHVEPTGEYDKDCRTGARFALDFLRYEAAGEPGSGYLALIVKDMPAGAPTGIEVGFLQTIGYAAQFGLHQAERTAMMETHGALVNQRPDGSVVIEQPDGTRAVYRKV